MNQASHAICEQNVHLPRFDNRRDLAFTKVRVQHCLSTAIRAGAIVRRKNLVGSPARGAGFMRNLIATGLVDEFHLAIHPVVLGAGLPIFNGSTKPFYLKLVDVKAFPGGTIVHTYGI